jgi:tight adherence protein C
VALVADLFVVGLSAGLTVRQCTRSVAGLVGGQVGESLGLAVAALDRGDSFVEAFFALSAQLDDSIAGFFGVLAVADRLGSGAAAVLSRFADHEREVERRRAQEALRTIPIRLLPPLIVCVLPAFCLTTVVPVIAAVLGSLELSLP